MHAPQSDRDIETELRSLAERAAAASGAHESLATDVLRGARAARRRRTRTLAVTVGVGLVACTAAAATLGRGPYFSVVQPSGSMSPAVEVGDAVIFDRDLSAATGDVVYLKVDVEGRGVGLMSRIVAESGDVVSCPATPRGTCATVLVNGRRLADAYLDDLETRPFPATEVPAGTVFVLGDNRSTANDSRFLGPVPTDVVEGVAVAIGDHDGDRYAIPGAPHHRAPGGQDVIDPPLPPPPASTSRG